MGQFSVTIYEATGSVLSDNQQSLVLRFPNYRDGPLQRGRFNGKVAKHWDNLPPITPPNPSGHTQIDGPVEITDLDKTAENKALVTDFVETILKNGEVDRITNFLSTETYIQHNSNIADGLDGLGAALAGMAEQGIQMVYTDVHYVVAEGNFVLTASEGTFADKPIAFNDLFRVEDGKIVEHWDVIADIPSEMAHDNGKF